ncbi:MAG TPA: 4-(cytidine 5'-diphospho)-2-C-methyl-D-erythritol kinase [Syntrophobacteraceae bacterium]|nr:4-(cytidine 5'-diphospho)-2-C-methyl-D-erythritol kinase [Syntrophobacteraceae bacterium]
MCSETRVIAWEAPAKINLWLEVIGKRKDGYHDISSLMLPISVFDIMSIEVRPGDETISIGCDTPEIPCDERNLAWRAAEVYVKNRGIKAGIHIDLKKNIPSGAGLGGGSSDAAGVLVALNSFFENALGPVDLERLAVSLGADVPFFLYSRPALATGIGEKLQFVEMAACCPLLLIKPPVIVPTVWVYQSLKLTKALAQITLNGLGEGLRQLGDLVQNDLESVTMPRYPVIAELKDWLIAHGALAASMSGSGPTVFGIFDTQPAAKETAMIARKDWPDCWVHTAQVISY